MTSEVAQLLEKAVQLSTAERAELADCVVEHKPGAGLSAPQNWHVTTDWRSLVGGGKLGWGAQLNSY